MNIVPCLTWVRRGIAKSIPEKVQLSKEELKKIIEETQDAIDDADNIEWSDVDSDDGSGDDESLEGATAAKNKKKGGKSVELGKRKKVTDGGGILANDDKEYEIVKKYGLDDYDENEEASVNPLHGIGRLSYYSTNDDDPYITLKDDDSDTEDYEIKPSDNLLVIGRAQEDMCVLEVNVYNELSGSLYVHHDILLPSFPLAVEWLSFDTADSKPGNFVAVGTMLPNIDIWDLDLVDSLEPVATLQGNRNKKSAKKRVSSGGHTDAVLDLSWNSLLRNVLGSASADCTIGLWDLSEGKMASCLKHHTGKVQCVAWHPFEAQSLLSGSFDHTVRVYDCRSGDASHKCWNLQGEIERLRWNHFSPFHFLASTDRGMVYCVDVRTDKPVYTLSAHSEAVSGLSLSSEVADLLVTSSADQTIKVWDLHDNKPSLILEKNLKMNELHCLECCPEAPYVFAVGGGSQLKVWDIRDSAAVKKHFADRISEKPNIADAENIPVKEMDDVTSSAMKSLQIGASSTDKKKPKKKRKKTKKSN